MNQKSNALVTIDLKLHWQIDSRKLARLLLVAVAAAWKLWLAPHVAAV